MRKRRPQIPDLPRDHPDKRQRDHITRIFQVETKRKTIETQPLLLGVKGREVDYVVAGNWGGK
jgi:hypothetical protein